MKKIIATILSSLILIAVVSATVLGVRCGGRPGSPCARVEGVPQRPFRPFWAGKRPLRGKAWSASRLEEKR